MLSDSWWGRTLQQDISQQDSHQNLSLQPLNPYFGESDAQQVHTAQPEQVPDVVLFAILLE